MTVYERIKNRRKTLGLSADDVALALGVSRATVYRYESADIEKLPITSLEPLSKVLHCSPGYLMGWEELKGENIIEEQIKAHFGSAADGMLLFSQLDAEDRAEIKGEMKQMLKADKYQHIQKNICS